MRKWNDDRGGTTLLIASKLIIQIIIFWVYPISTAHFFKSHVVERIIIISDLSNDFLVDILMSFGVIILRVIE